MVKTWAVGMAEMGAIGAAGEVVVGTSLSIVTLGTSKVSAIKK